MLHPGPLHEYPWRGLSTAGGPRDYGAAVPAVQEGLCGDRPAPGMMREGCLRSILRSLNASSPGRAGSGTPGKSAARGRWESPLPHNPLSGPDGVQRYVGSEGQDIAFDGVKPDPLDEPCGPLSRSGVLPVVIEQPANEVESFIF